MTPSSLRARTQEVQNGAKLLVEVESAANARMKKVQDDRRIAQAIEDFEAMATHASDEGKDHVLVYMHMDEGVSYIADKLTQHFAAHGFCVSRTPQVRGFDLVVSW